MAHFLPTLNISPRQSLHHSSSNTSLMSVASTSSLSPHQRVSLTQQQHDQERQPRSRWTNTGDITEDEGHACTRCDSLSPTLYNKNNLKAFSQLRSQYQHYAIRLIGERGWSLGDAVRAAKVRYEGVKQRLREEKDQSRLDRQLERERDREHRERERRSAGVPPAATQLGQERNHPVPARHNGQESEQERRDRVLAEQIEREQLEAWGDDMEM